jgi:uncharacterized protein (TIGR04222 family)
MNPFDLPGPQFLEFYLVLGIVVLAAFRWALRRTESGEPPALPLNDPYQIAYLRGGAAETARVAVMSLIDRGLLEVTGNQLERRATPWLSSFPPIERVILERCALPAQATAVLSDARIVAACEAYHARLEELRLLPDPAAKARRWSWFAIAATILLGIGAIKIVVALGRGRTNVELLVIFMVVGLVLLAGIAVRRRTGLGDAMLADLSRLFGALRRRAASLDRGTMTSDAMLVAAVFGLAALPVSAFPEVRRIYAQAASGGGDGGSGSSCGSGCGGGGGGGCGGCGS